MEEMKQSTENTPKTAPAPLVFAVRAIPAPGHAHRWCAGRPFSREASIVTVTDSPKPHSTVTSPETLRTHITEYSYELTPGELEELRADPHIAITLAGVIEAEALDLNEARATVATLQQKLKAAETQNAVLLAELEQARQNAPHATRVAEVQAEHEQAKRNQPHPETDAPNERKAKRS